MDHQSSSGVQIWDIRMSCRILAFEEITNDNHRLFFSPDRRHPQVAYRNGSLRARSVVVGPVPDFIARLRRVRLRELTGEQRARFHQPPRGGSA